MSLLQQNSAILPKKQCYNTLPIGLPEVLLGGGSGTSAGTQLHLVTDLLDLAEQVNQVLQEVLDLTRGSAGSTTSLEVVVETPVTTEGQPSGLGRVNINNVVLGVPAGTILNLVTDLDLADLEIDLSLVVEAGVGVESVRVSGRVHHGVGAFPSHGREIGGISITVSGQEDLERGAPVLGDTNRDEFPVAFVLGEVTVVEVVGIPTEFPVDLFLLSSTPM
eukprot:TRINITY_DN1766_c0_g1_i2.p2 TRINITY_DN1766_c0_g1~~TRINITY_DN1766_c0_g1_i2.p2  ORF type:complete len:220 (+),score=15.63 TRINITY_DN1766_c0_g1_i2:120-779(+)